LKLPPSLFGYSWLIFYPTMNELKKIVWLASYPKSGNTWLRAFLANILLDETPNINSLSIIPIASSRDMFDENVGIDSSELTADEIDELRPAVYTSIAKDSKSLRFFKIHDAWQKTPSGKELIPPQITKAVIYIIRNPLDVAVSFAHHTAASTDTVVKLMNESSHNFCAATHKLYPQLRQKLTSWSNHVTTWVDDSGLPLMVLRYEDMLNNPVESFEKVIRFLNLKCSQEKLLKAIENTSFEKLSKQEEQFGFKEKSIKAAKFFRKGKAGSWKEELSPEAVNKIITDHQIIMKRFGYLTVDNQPIF
jgi:aryl sulfotransferase